MSVKKLFEELNVNNPSFESFDIFVGGCGFPDIYQRYNIITNNIPFIPYCAFIIQAKDIRLINPMSKWCEENNISYHSGMLVFTIVNTCWVYFFSVKTDAIAFKLRWV